MVSERRQSQNTISLHFPAHDACLLVCVATGGWNSGFSGQTQGEDSVWLCEDSLKGLECGPGCNWGVCAGQSPGPSCEGRGRPHHSSVFTGECRQSAQTSALSSCVGNLPELVHSQSSEGWSSWRRGNIPKVILCNHRHLGTQTRQRHYQKTKKLQASIFDKYS